MLSNFSRARLNEILFYIRRNPETHEQSVWTNIPHGVSKVKKDGALHVNCGTTACLAGHGAFRYAPPHTIFFKETLQLPGKPVIEYESYARKIFGLKCWEADYLFDESRNLANIDAFVNDPIVYEKIRALFEGSECDCGCSD